MTANLKNPAQRVGVFVDVQNLYYSAKALYGQRVNFNEVLMEAVSGRQLVRAIAYTIKAEMPEEQSFFDALAGIGFEVKSKELQTFVSGQKKGDWDVGVAVDVLKMAPKLDAIVLVSGDGDYVDLLHHVKAEGCRAEIISFGKSTSQKLKEEADDFFDMDSESERFTLRPKNGNVPRPRPEKQQPSEPKPMQGPESEAKGPQTSTSKENEVRTRKPQTPRELENAIIKATESESQHSQKQNRKFKIFKK